MPHAQPEAETSLRRAHPRVRPQHSAAIFHRPQLSVAARQCTYPYSVREFLWVFPWTQPRDGTPDAGWLESRKIKLRRPTLMQPTSTSADSASSMRSVRCEVQK